MIRNHVISKNLIEIVLNQALSNTLSASLFPQISKPSVINASNLDSLINSRLNQYEFPNTESRSKVNVLFQSIPGNFEPKTVDLNSLNSPAPDMISKPTTTSLGINNTNNSAIPKWSAPPKVLLVEDDDTCRRLSSKLLQIFGCNFDIAVDGLDAVNRMNVGNKYDMVLMDIMMPNLDGVSATTRIRQFDQFTPIISMTSNITETDCMTYLANGMNDILVKPFNKSSLLGMIKRHCSNMDATPSDFSDFLNESKNGKVTDISGGKSESLNPVQVDPQIFGLMRMDSSIPQFISPAETFVHSNKRVKRSHDLELEQQKEDV